jgi:hypothetical protein
MLDSVRWRDARAAFRLLDEVKQLGHDPCDWRRHLLLELGALVGAQVGLAGEAPRNGFLSPTTHVGCTDVGWSTDRDRRVWLAACERTERDLDPTDVALARFGSASYTRMRHELVPNADWYRSPMFNDHYRPAGLDHYLVSHRYVPEHRLVHYLILFKDGRRARFTDREARLVHYIHRELASAWTEASRVALPRRLWETLSCLQAGCSEKEIASRLGIAPHTVHTYCKQLHRKFGARSRGELLARTRSLPRAPRLLLAARVPFVTVGS